MPDDALIGIRAQGGQTQETRGRPERQKQLREQQNRKAATNQRPSPDPWFWLSAIWHRSTIRRI